MWYRIRRSISCGAPDRHKYPMRQLSENLFLYEDSCYVYVIRTGETAILVDFGSGGVLDELASIGVQRVTDVLITHHHRDQLQGFPRAISAGIRLWVPHSEQDLIAEADSHWQAREIYNNYNMRQDRFSPLSSVPIAGTLRDYDRRRFGPHDFLILPTPGHTIGSITLLAQIDGAQIAFTGDLIAGPGRVWSLAATQWTYNGAEGVAASLASLLDLKDRQPDMLLPSHGEPMPDPDAAINRLAERLNDLLQLRGHNLRLLALREHPYEAITPHVLRHRASMANSFVLLSESKKALFFDFGYDFMTGFSSGYDRASRRPWLYTLPALKRDYAVEKIDVVVPTHFHDDHVAGIELLHRVENTQVWAADIFADILENPAKYDLPCLWYDPVPVDRRLPLETPIRWEEYMLTLHHLPGHTLYAVAISFEADGTRYLVSGDQYQGEAGLDFNYVYQNLFQAGDYAKSAALYRRLNPQIILTGHWNPLQVPPDYFDQLDERGAAIERLHTELLAQPFGPSAEGALAQLRPYQINAIAGEPFEVCADIRSPFSTPADVSARLIVPEGWRVLDATSPGHSITLHDDRVTLRLDSSAPQRITFRVMPSEQAVRRARISVDLSVNQRHFGQQGEALVTIRPPS